MKICVVIPTFNEVENIQAIVPEVLAQDDRIEVLVVDDGSPDGTGLVVEEMRRENGRIHLLNRFKKDGLCKAYLAGFDWALSNEADLIIQMDADFSHDPKYLPTFIELAESHDVVIGSRYVNGGGTENWPWYRKLISMGGSLYSRLLLGGRIQDVSGGFKCFRRTVLESLDLDCFMSNGFGFQIEMNNLVTQAGFDVVETPITFNDRRHGTSKMSASIFWEALFLVIRLRLFGRRYGRSVKPSRHMSILQVIAEAPPIKSGVAKVAAELEDGLRAKGHVVHTISSVDIPRVSLGEYRFSAFIFKWPKLRHLLDHYDVINIHAPAPTFTDLFLLFASNFGLNPRKARIVMTYHCEIDLPGFIIKPLTDLYSWTHKRFAWLVAHTIVTSRSYADMFAHVKPENLSIIPWGVDQTQFKPVDNLERDKALTVTFIGQMRPYKGLDVLLKAMVGLSKVHLNVIGGGHHAEEYKNLARSLDLTNVSFLGKVSDEDLIELVKTSDTLVLPSLTKAEAFGIVLLEAMAAGCVPIASDLPGVRDVIGHAGLTFPVGDSDTLREQLAMLRDKPETLDLYAQQSRAKSKRYTWNRSVEAHEALFHQISMRASIQAELKKKKELEPVMMKMLSVYLRADAFAVYRVLDEMKWAIPAVFTSSGDDRNPFYDAIFSSSPAINFGLSQERTLLYPNDIENTYLDGQMGPFEGYSCLIASVWLDGEKRSIVFLRAEDSMPFSDDDRAWLDKALHTYLADLIGGSNETGMSLTLGRVASPQVESEVALPW